LKLIQGAKLNLLIKDPIDTFQNIRDQTTICHFPCQMTSFWILLFIICLPKTGSTGENPADHGHYTHDAVIISRFHRFHDAHHLWRQGHQTFSGFIKARERPGKRGGIGKRKTRKPEAKKSKTEELNRKSLEEQRRKTQHTEEEKQGGRQAE